MSRAVASTVGLAEMGKRGSRANQLSRSLGPLARMSPAGEGGGQKGSQCGEGLILRQPVGEQNKFPGREEDEKGTAVCSF